MANLSAPEQNRLLAQLASLLRGREEVQAQMNPTMMGTLMDLILPSAQTVEKLSYGDPLFRMPPSGTGGYIPQTADKQYVAEVAGMLPLGAPAAKPSARAMQKFVNEIRTTPPVGAVNIGKPVSQAAGLLEDVSYRGSHTAPNKDFGAPLYELNKIYPDDIYSPQAARLYGHFGGSNPMDAQTTRLAQSFRGKPDADVTIYRAVPKDDNIKAINAGDWVTINPAYAREHGESALRGEYKVLKKKVKAKDIWTNADSIHEYGYNP